MKVKAIVEFRKFQYDLNGFWLVRSRETSMLFAVENSFTTFVDEMGADWILCVVERFVEGLLLWQQHDGTKVRLSSRGHITVL